MLGEEVDMVGDDHQVTHMEVLVHTARGIRHEEGLDAQLVHYTYGECHFLHRVAFIIVKTTLHGEDVNTPEFSEYKFPAMTFYCGYREVGNFRVGILCLVSYF